MLEQYNVYCNGQYYVIYIYWSSTWGEFDPIQLTWSAYPYHLVFVKNQVIRHYLVIWTMEQHARTWEESPNIAKLWRKQVVNRQYTGDFDAIVFITRYGINPYLYSGFLWARCSPWDVQQRVGPSALGLHLTGDVSSLGRRCHTNMVK